MMKVTKMKTISGQTLIDNKVIVSMFAQKQDNGNSTLNISINDQELYDSNKATCDEDIDKFKKEAEQYLS